MIRFKEYITEYNEKPLGTHLKKKKSYKNKKPGKWFKRVGTAVGSAVGATAGWLTHGTHGGMAGAALGAGAGYKAGEKLSNIKRAAKTKAYLRKRSKRNR